MSTRFFTNRNDNSLLKKFEGVFTHVDSIRFFDALVGYFRASGYFKVRPFLDRIPKVRLGSDINSKVLAFAFGLSAEIERNLISQRTKEALARKKAEGVVLGRPVGRKSTKTKLTGHEMKIQELLDRKVSYSAIARILGVHRLTVSSFLKQQSKS